MILEMNNIRKHFDGLGVLEDISFGVEKGEVVSIIGPSGSGKSTLLRCATFLEEIDGGEIRYMGEKAAWTDADGKAVYVPQRDMRRFRSYCGLVFQQFNLFPHYNILKNLHQQMHLYSIWLILLIHCCYQFFQVLNYHF